MGQVTYRPIFMVTPDDEYTQEQRSAYLEFVSCLEFDVLCIFSPAVLQFADVTLQVDWSDG